MSDLATDIKNQRHLTAADFKGVQQIHVQIDFKGAPVEFAKMKKALWEMRPHIGEMMKINTAMIDRDLAPPEMRKGFLDRIIPLHFQVVQQQNTFPYYVGLTIPGLMPTVSHAHGNHLWRIPPDTPTQAVGEKHGSVFQPVNLITQGLYKGYQNCTAEDIQSDIKILKDKEGQEYALVATDSFAHDKLKDELDAGRWETEDAALDFDNIYEPGHNQRDVQVTAKIGKELKQMLGKDVERMLKSCMNVETTVGYLERADGVKDMENTTGYHGEIIGNELVGNVSSVRANTVSSAHVHAIFTFKFADPQ